MWRATSGGSIIVGHVETPRVCTFAELTALPAVEQETTLQCISYGVGSGLISNAVWKGVPLPTLLAQVKPKAGHRAVLFHAADGYFETFPFCQGDRADDARRLGDERRAAAAAARIPSAPDRARHLRRAEPEMGHAAGVPGRGRSAAEDQTARDRGRRVLYRAGLGAEHLRADDQPLRRAARWPATISTSRSRWGSRWSCAAWRSAATRASARWSLASTTARRWTGRADHRAGHADQLESVDATWTPRVAGRLHLVVRATNADGQPQITENRGPVPMGATGLHRVRGTVEAA